MHNRQIDNLPKRIMLFSDQLKALGNNVSCISWALPIKTAAIVLKRKQHMGVPMIVCRAAQEPVELSSQIDQRLTVSENGQPVFVEVKADAV